MARILELSTKKDQSKVYSDELGMDCMCFDTHVERDSICIMAIEDLRGELPKL